MKMKQKRVLEAEAELTESSSPKVLSKESPTYKLLAVNDLPDSQFETVKLWLKALIEKFAQVARKLENKITKNLESQVFQADGIYEFNDINKIIMNVYKTIDWSMSGHSELRSDMEDYIGTFKAVATIPQNEDDELSAPASPASLPPETETAESPAVEEPPDNEDEAPTNEKSTPSDSNKTDNVPRIRVRNLSELIAKPECDKPEVENVKTSSKSDSKTNKTESSTNSSSSNSEDCVIISTSKQNGSIDKKKSTTPESKSYPKIFTSSDEEPTVLPQTKKKSPSSKLVVISSSDSEDSDVRIIADEKEDKKLDESKTKDPDKSKISINWDTSSAESDDDWMSSKKGGKGNSKKKKEMEKEKKTRREKEKSKKKDVSSEDELNKLCNIRSLSAKRKRGSSLSSSSSVPDDCSTKKEEENKKKEEEKKRKEEEKKKKEEKKEERRKDKEDKKATKKQALAECINSDSDLSEMDFNYDDWIGTLRTSRMERETTEEPNIEAFGKIFSDSEGLDVLSDSSMDSIVEELGKSNVQQKINRGTSVRKAKEEPKEGDEEKEKKKSRRRFRDKLLTGKLTDTDTSEGEAKWEKHKMKTRIHSSESSGGEEAEPKKPVKEENGSKKREPKGRKKKLTNIFSDDSDVANLDESSDEEKEKSENEEDKMEDEEETDEDEKKKKENKKKRKRIQRQSDSSDDGEPSPSKSGDGKGRRNIRKVLKEESLAKTTKEALKEEQERKQRIAEKQKLYNALIGKALENANNAKEVKVLEELVLDFDVEKKEPIVEVDKDLVRKLKPHQAQGVKFMWDSCFESAKEAQESAGSGCILAHCMGLGKTLQVITLVHTLLTSEKVDVNRVLVVSPFSTVQNWVNEFRKWLKDVGSGEDFELYDMLKTAPNHRQYQLRDWERTGGVMILGYNLFRSLVSPKGRVKASVKKAIAEVLLDPGPDVVVCDEGHILKNEKTAVNIAMSKIKTRRRIVLTGTPLQNNLIEYHCMVQFVKPNLLGTRKEFQNRFVSPIQNGQFEDSTAHDVKVMKRRAHVLHKMLDGIVQRKDYNVLTPYLPPKYEYVIHVKLTEVQIKLYRHYLENFAHKSKNEGGGLFQDFQHLMRICTHPRSLLIHSNKAELKREMEDDSEGSLKDFIDDSNSEESTPEESSPSSDSDGSGSTRSKTPPKKKRGTRTTRASGPANSSDEEPEVEAPKRTEWWSEMVTEEELTDIKSSSKLFLFFTILKHSEEIGDKLLVFSQSLYTLDLIEHFLQLVDDNNRLEPSEQNSSLSQFSSNWDKGIDYFRLDGGTTSDNRAHWCKVFNNANNTRARLFLISTRAGGLGINLTGANRVIIFDASWNPSYDVQSIFRVYRFGQTKPCYIYRFLAKGTMEEKIYERQVAKLSTSLRVIDEQQIDRHFTQTSLAELYAFNPEEPEVRETPALPKDRLMAELLQSFPEIILKHHQHDSLLENIEDEELNEEERKAAWADFENEKNNVPPPNPFLAQGGFMGQQGMMNPAASFNLQYQVIIESLISKIKAQNPTLNEDFVKQRAIETVQQMPFFRNQQLLMNNYIQQQQQQYMKQQQFLQQQQMMLARQQAPAGAGSSNAGSLHNLLSGGAQNISPAELFSRAFKNGSGPPPTQGVAKPPSSATGSSTLGKPSQPTESPTINLD